MAGDKKFTILIVDDERSNIVVLSNILRTSYVVLAAKDGQSAVEVAKSSRPDLILLDIIMPGMSGFEVIAELKNSPLTINIPVIFITGIDSNESEERGLSLGAVDYITKPFHNSIVKLRVKTHQKIIEQMRTIERLGMIDALTNIPNRRSFDNQLSVEWNRAMRAQTPLSIMMLDIDDFKIFNDTYGHAHGDEVLKTVADNVAQSLKRASDFAARWGGEEFAVLLPNTDLNGALEMAEQIRVNIENAVTPHADATSLKVTVSIGVYSAVSMMDMSIDDFCSKADKALYSAKKSGKNAVKAFEYLEPALISREHLK